MGALFLLLFQNGNPVGIVAGLLVSGPLYLLIGYVMAKFGYQRKSWKDMRAESRRPSSDDRSTDGVAGPRPKPAPTSRTGGGRPGGARKKRR
jgi:hypothetical protein